MTKVRLYAAISADGFIADHEGGVDWLDDFEPSRYGYNEFYADVGAVLMGRRTYELVRTLGQWPYRDKRAFVLSSRSLGELPKGVTQVGSGIVPALKAARETTDKDIWIVGGGFTMQSALAARLFDQIDLFVVPFMLGAGLTLTGPLEKFQPLSLLGIETFPDGVVKLSYKPVVR